MGLIVRRLRDMQLRWRLFGAFIVCGVVVAVSVVVSITSLRTTHSSLTSIADTIIASVDDQGEHSRRLITLREIIAGMNVAKDLWALQDAESKLCDFEKLCPEGRMKQLGELVRKQLLVNRNKYIQTQVELELSLNQVGRTVTEFRSARQAADTAYRKGHGILQGASGGLASDAAGKGDDVRTALGQLDSLLAEAVLAGDAAAVAQCKSAFAFALDGTVSEAVAGLAQGAAREAVAQGLADLKSVAEAVFDAKTRMAAAEEAMMSVETRLAQANEGMATAEKAMAASSAKVLREMNVLQEAFLESSQRVSDSAERARRSSGELVGGRERAQIVLAVLAIPFAMLIPLLFSRSILKRLSQAVELARAIRGGDLTWRVEASSADEIGQLTSGLNAMAESLQEKDAEIRHNIASLKAVFGRVATAADQIANGSEQLSDSSQSLSQGATEQASSLEEIASATTQIGAQTKANAGNASRANSLASSCCDVATEGNEQVQEMLGAMHKINEASGRIAKIIKVIDDIAFQTNLLALNAAVEAARAGRHGKGFAVVAEEVRSLAGRSSKAAQETEELIRSSVERVRNGMQLAERSAASLADIVTSATQVSNLVREIAVASDEQAQGIAQVSQGLDQIDGVTQQNMASAEQTASASEELAGQAGQLRGLLTEFHAHDADVGADAGEASRLPLLEAPGGSDMLQEKLEQWVGHVSGEV